MDFEEVMACLEITKRREEFIARLKNAGENSSAVLHLQKAMTELKMHQPPRGIDQKTIIQHTLRFSDVDECFQTFRVVCKSWKDAVETIRFNRVVGNEFFYNLDDNFDKISQEISPASYLGKYLPLFRKLYMPLMDLTNENKIFPLVVNNMKKLNEIIFATDGEEICEQFDSFAFQILQNSNKTLRTLNIPKFVIPDISFPKLTNLHLRIGENNILLHEFQNYFPKTLKNMENLKTVELDLWKPGCLPVCQHICENYDKHCISALDVLDDILNSMPVKILEGINPWILPNKKYTSHLEYVHVYIDAKNPMRLGWDRYQELFDQCINLKAIELGAYSSSNFVTETLPSMPEANQEIWKERISYFQARGIRIANLNEIQGNENLRIRVAKEAGVTWKFHFY